MAVLLAMQVKLSEATCRPIQECKTRWTSLFEMLNWFRRNQVCCCRAAHCAAMLQRACCANVLLLCWFFNIAVAAEC